MCFEGFVIFVLALLNNNTSHLLHFKIALVKAINYSLTHSLLNPPLPLVLAMISLDVMTLNCRTQL